MKLILFLVALFIGQNSFANYLCENGEGHKIALTFDDGPHSSNTNKVLNALKDRDIQATFFHLGRQADTRMGLVEKMLDQGHKLANHGWDHIDYSNSSVAAQRNDLEKSTDLFSEMFEAWFFRLPYGAGFRGAPQRLVESYGYTHVYWNIDPRDWDARLSAEQSFQRIQDALSRPPNSLYPKAHILLLHDIQNKTANNFASWADRILADGHCFVELTTDLLEGTAMRQAPKTLFQKGAQLHNQSLTFSSMELSPLEIRSEIQDPSNRIKLPQALEKLEILDLIETDDQIHLISQWTIGHGKLPVYYSYSKKRDAWRYQGKLSCDSAMSFELKKGELEYQCADSSHGH